MMRPGGQVGRACTRQAASPATSGQENEVPSWNVYPESAASAIQAETPQAARSGFTRPSALGP